MGSTVMLQGTTNGSMTDINGSVEIKNIPDGKHVIFFRHIGYFEKRDTLLFPLADSTAHIIFLQSEVKEMGEVLVSATRSSRTISDIPTRIETISSGELEEKNTMQPANAKMILTESTAYKRNRLQQHQQMQAYAYKGSTENIPSY